jgi:hypothetical protein
MGSMKTYKLPTFYCADTRMGSMKAYTLPTFYCAVCHEELCAMFYPADSPRVMYTHHDIGGSSCEQATSHFFIFIEKMVEIR